MGPAHQQLGWLIQRIASLGRALSVARCHASRVQVLNLLQLQDTRHDIHDCGAACFVPCLPVSRGAPRAGDVPFGHCMECGVYGTSMARMATAVVRQVDRFGFGGAVRRWRGRHVLC